MRPPPREEGRVITKLSWQSKPFSLFSFSQITDLKLTPKHWQSVIHSPLIWSCLILSAYNNIYQVQCNTPWMSKSLRVTQTLHAGCSKAEPTNFAPPQTPFPGAWDGQNLISWRWSLPSPTDPVWWGSMHAISSYRGNRPTPSARPL